MEDVENVDNPSSGSPDEIPQPQATLIGAGPNANNDCPICVKYKSLMSYYNQRTHHDEKQLERFLLESLPELHFVEEIKDWEHQHREGKLVPLKQTAKTLTLHLLNGHFVKRGDTFFYGNCHGSEFKNCVVRSAIQKEVHKVFPNADAEFDTNVQLWFSNQPSSSVVRSTDAYRAVLRKCIICREQLTCQAILDNADKAVNKTLLKYFPERPSNLREMVDGFLVNYFLKVGITGPLTLTKNCFGEKFGTCLVMLKIWKRGTELFSIDNCNAFSYAQDWFKEQRKSFEDIESITIVDRQELDTPNVIKINLPEECKKDAATMIGGILDYIFKKYYVGFVLVCGVSKRIPIRLDNKIYDMILETFPELQMENYEDCVKEWFESRV